MGKKDVFTKILACIGTALACLPILAPIVISIVFFIRAGIFRLDYLMPAELFPSVFLGAVLLIWAAIRARTYRSLIGWSIGIAIAMLVGGQALAEVTGLASGAIEPAGIWWALVMAMIVIYSLAVIGLGIGGILLLKKLFGLNQMPAKTI
jgi:hypothetical protein